MSNHGSHHRNAPIMTERAARIALDQLEATRAMGERVRYARERSGVTQRELSLAISKSPGTVYNVEQGRRALTRAELVAVSRVLGVSIGWLRGSRVTARDIEGSADRRRMYR